MQLRRGWSAVAILTSGFLAVSVAWGGAGDADNNGFIDLRDFPPLVACFEGPASNPGMDCISRMDLTDNGTVDLADFAGFQSSQGHLPIPLLDPLGDWIELGSTAPYSGRQTCGPCHDLTIITNGFHFQQGRTDTAGHVVIQDDYFQDGRTWEKSPGRFGRFSQATARVLASKTSADESKIDSTPFDWIQNCSGCHPGGGPGEFDRDGRKLFDESTGLFGYETAGLTAQDVRLDGDYAYMNRSTGQLSHAPWHVTGVSEPDCLTCHRTERTWINGADMNRTWRANILAAGPALTDLKGVPVPAFLAAATAGQGWFSSLVTNPAPPKLQIDYSVGIDDGSLVSPDAQHVSLATQSLRSPPRDQVCFGCHRDMTGVAGVIWFDDRDIHYAKFNNLRDQDPGNDIAPQHSAACNYCHPGNIEHNFAKGNSLQIQQRNDLDYVGLRACRDCHLETSPVRHPEAPVVPGEVTVHLVPPFEILACQACHMPYLFSRATLFIDTTLGGAGRTSQYLSADPLDPANPDKSRWYPALKKKRDSDGVERWFPTNYWVNIYWADWNQNGTPADMTDDTLEPILQWRINQVTGGAPLPVVTDDNADGRLEINRKEEILAYITAFQATDSYGRQLAANPVLIKGRLLWYADPQAPGGVASLEHADTPLPVRWEAYSWDVNHNIHKKEDAWGVGQGADICLTCHADGTSPVMDRKILVDPYGLDGQPVYETVRSMTGLNP
jgi:hypothetical protein